MESFVKEETKTNGAMQPTSIRDPKIPWTANRALIWEVVRGVVLLHKPKVHT